MNLAKLAIGRDPPREVNVVVEIPAGGDPVKYEMDKESGALFVDRFMHTAMVYPANYGFVPHTLAEDGDPLDVLVAGPVPVAVGAVLPARPIGVLLMTDDKGPDEKILAVPADRLHPYHAGVRSYRDLPPILTEQIAHFFAHYKDLERGRWAKVAGWAEVDVAHAKIAAAIERARK